MAFDDAGNVRVDFVWGRTAMQPNTGRSGNGPVTLIEEDGDQNKGWSGTVVFPSEPLDETLGDHINAAVRWNGFPDYINENPFTDTIPNLTVPDYVGEVAATSATAALALGFSVPAMISTHVGATTVNDGKVKAQTPAAGTLVNTGTNLILTKFVAPTVPDVTGLTEEAAETALLAAHLTLGTVTTSEVGATELNDGKVKSQSVAADTKANTGSAVDVVLYAYVAPGGGE